MKTLNASEGKVRKYTLKGCVFTAYFVLMQSIRNIQHLGEVNLLKVKRQQKRDLCANGLIKSLESSCLNSLRVTFPEKKKKKNHTQQNPEQLPQATNAQNVIHYHLKENN